MADEEKPAPRPPKRGASPRGLRAALAGLVAALLAGAPAGALRADEKAAEGAEEPTVPALAAKSELGGLEGAPVVAIEVVPEGDLWEKSARAARVTRLRPGEPLTPDAVRAAMRELAETGAFAEIEAEARPAPGGARLLLRVLPRRIVAAVRVSGGDLDEAGLLAAAGIRQGAEVTPRVLEALPGRVREHYARHGFPKARVGVRSADTDDPSGVVVAIDVAPGPPRVVYQRVFVIDPRADPRVFSLKDGYAVEQGDRMDDESLRAADRELTERLQAEGFESARVRHAFKDVGGRSYLYVYVDAGPRTVLSFEGNRRFDDDMLSEALGASGATGRPSEIAERVRKFYEARGFLDAEVSGEVRPPAPGREGLRDVVITVRENRRVRVTRRVYPCFEPDGEWDFERVGDEIDTFLEEGVGGSPLFGIKSPEAVDLTLGPTKGGDRARPLTLNPAQVYSPDAYERALEHLRQVFQSRGYLDPVVGPVTVIRPACARHAPPGLCVPVPPPALPRAACDKDPLGVPLPEPEPPEGLECRPDPAAGIECAPRVELWIPIHLGPRTFLYDVAFEGRFSASEARLAEVADLRLGEPVSTAELEAARLRVLDWFRERGYAFAEVTGVIEPSPDRTRARARFSVQQRERVVVSGFEVRGARRTSESLIRRRIALSREGPFTPELARLSEERIATLGTFSSVTVALENPDVVEHRKRVIVTVVEQSAQYLDPRVGFSTGEGVRFAAEYGHRNIAGEAIQLTVRVQLSYLFDFMVLDEQVRENYETLSGSQRLERRNTITVTFPQVGLGPLIGLSVEGADVRDNQRNFGLTRQAVSPALTFRPRRALTAQLGGSLELNDVQIFGAENVEAAIRQNRSLANLLRVPDGRTTAVAQRVSAAWDRRDTPFAATSGTLLAGALEHVNAFPLGDDAGDEPRITSHFLRLSGRIAAYAPLPLLGASFAASLGAGYNVQLASESKTYPDRLFFLGGVDSLRSFLQSALVPEDIARRILEPTPGQKALTIDDVAIRGGDASINPRLELRLPLGGVFQLGLFLDAGNVWVDTDAVDLLRLRYAGGAGLRIATPIGPIAFDYGVNLDRRPWEDFGAFHFSIGLF